MTNTADLGGDTLPRLCCFFCGLVNIRPKYSWPNFGKYRFFFSVKKQKNGSRRCVRIRYNDYLCIMNLSKESFVCQKRLI